MLEFNDYCQFIIAISGVVGVIITFLLNFFAVRKQNKLNCRNAILDIKMRSEMIQDRINGNLDFCILKQMLWKHVEHDVMTSFSYTKDNEGNVTDTVSYIDPNDKTTKKLTPKARDQFNIVSLFMSQHSSKIMSLRKTPIDIKTFEDDVFALEFYHNFGFHRFSKLNIALGKYINTLHEFENACKAIISKIELIQCMTDFAEAIEFVEDLNETRIPETKINVDNYVSNLRWKNLECLYEKIEAVNNAYKTLVEHLK